MRVFLAAVMIASLAGPAFAQDTHVAPIRGAEGKDAGRGSRPRRKPRRPTRNPSAIFPTRVPRIPGAMCRSDGAPRPVAKAAPVSGPRPIPRPTARQVAGDGTPGQVTIKTPDQIAYWNGPGGQRWAARQASQDIRAGPCGRRPDRSRRCQAGRAHRDVGCGAGANPPSHSRRRFVPIRTCHGIDISGPMLAARAKIFQRGYRPISCWRTPRSIRSSLARFDLLASRFGRDVFADRRARVLLQNLAQGDAGPSGRPRVCAAGASRAKIRLFMAPLQAVYKHAPKLPPPGPEVPARSPFRLRCAREPHPGRGRIFLTSRWKVRDLFSIFARSFAVGRGVDVAVQSCARNRPRRPRARRNSRRKLVAAATQIDPRGADAIRGGTGGAAAGLDLDRDGRKV